MRLLRCRLFSPSRYRTLHLLSVLAIVIFSGCVVLSVSQLGQRESSSISHIPAVDYRTNSKANIIHRSNASSLKQPGVVKGSVNGRLLKGVDIGVSKKEMNRNLTMTETEASTAASSPPSNELVKNSPAPLATNNSHAPSHSDAPQKEQVTLDLLPSQIGADSLQLLKDYMFKVNKEQFVHNGNKFPPLSEHGLVLIVQAHRRDGYLRQLFESLRTVQGIEEVLLVISHDYYYDDMMKLVQTVDFCRVVQIFYPFSLQVYPDVFPGSSKDDCPRDSTKEEAVAMNCSNAQYPDKYGHYREAKITSIKHHWWWKANMVFDGLRDTRNFSGYVLFLEEDHYLYPDFLYMTKKMISFKESHLDDCDFINLGMYAPVKSPQLMAPKVSVEVWNAGRNNMGFGMNRKSWEVIKSCSQHFCKYDDYNWDWSLNSLGQECLSKNIKVLVSKLPRIYHIGNCGLHHTKTCNEKTDARKVTDKLSSDQKYLFPRELTLDGRLNPSARKKLPPFGGWGDIRDHKLCLSFVGNPLRNTL